MSTKKFNDSGKIYRFKVMQFDVWEQWGVPSPGAERPFGNPPVTEGGKGSSAPAGAGNGFPRQ